MSDNLAKLKGTFYLKCFTWQEQSCRVFQTSKHTINILSFYHSLYNVEANTLKFAAYIFKIH